MGEQVSARKGVRPAQMDVPYAGLVDGAPYVHDAPHLLVSGRTGSSKTRSVLAIQAASWGRRPVVAVSSKGDLAAMTARRRNKVGPCYLMDLAGEVSDAKAAELGLTRVASDPVALITDDDSAVELAGLLQEVGTLGSGDGKGGGDAFWMGLAEGPLAAILQASGWYVDPETGDDVWGGGIRWARRAALNSGVTDEKADEDAPVDLQTPSWDAAIARCATIDSIWGDELLAAKDLDPRQRDSIGINMRVALKAWASRKVAGRGELTPFTPDLLTDHTAATLFLTSPWTGSAASAASSTMTSIVNHWRQGAGERPTLLMVIDECPSISPLPRLGAWLADLRSYGVRIVAACQSSSQFAPRWGQDGLKILRDIFPGILILPGAPEREILEQAAWSMLPEERVTGSTGADGKTSLSRDRVASFEGSELLPRKKGTALLIVGGMPERVVDLVDISATTVGS